MHLVEFFAIDIRVMAEKTREKCKDYCCYLRAVVCFLLCHKILCFLGENIEREI